MKMIYIGVKETSFLTPNKVYNCEYTPKIYDPKTFNVIIGLIVKCDDEKFRRCEISDFISVEESRNKKISEILDQEKPVT